MSQSDQITRDGVYVDASYLSGKVSIIDIFKTLLRRKTLFFSTLLVCLLGSLLFTVLRPSVHSYTQFVKLANYLKENKTLKENEIEIVRKADSMLPLVKNYYLPAAVENYNNTVAVQNQVSINAFDANFMEKSVSFLNKGSVGSILDGVIYLTARGKDNKSTAFSNIFQQVMVDISREETANLALLKSSLQNELTNDKNTVDILTKQISNLKEQFVQTEKNAAPAVSDVSSADYNVHYNEKNINTKKIDRKVLSSLPAQILFLESLSKQSYATALYTYKLSVLNNLQLKQLDLMKLQSTISKLSEEYDSITPSKFSSSIIRSQYSVGLGKKIIVILGGVVGMFLGLLLVFLAEICSKK